MLDFFFFGNTHLPLVVVITVILKKMSNSLCLEVVHSAFFKNNIER